MRLAPLSEVPNGTTVTRDVFTGRDRAPLLRAGVRLTREYREGLLRAGVHAIYIEDALSEGIEPPRPLLGEQTQERAAQAVAETWTQAQAALAARRPLAPELADTLGEVLEEMLGEVRSAGPVAVALRDLCAADAYTFQHSIDVTALGMFLGAHVFADQGWSAEPAAGGHSQIEERLLVLGMGLLLHDIGKLIVPEWILRKSGPLSQAERELVEHHPQAGFDLVTGSGWSPLVGAVVLRHHERWNGSGYPDGLRGKEIHLMARIAAVADVFDAVTSDRPYAPARPAHVGIRLITDGSGTQFDPAVVATFARVVAPFQPGVELSLADGRRALVVSVPAEAPDRPRVRVLGNGEALEEIDLVDRPDLVIGGWSAALAA